MDRESVPAGRSAGSNPWRLQWVNCGKFPGFRTSTGPSVTPSERGLSDLHVKPSFTTFPVDIALYHPVYESLQWQRFHAVFGFEQSPPLSVVWELHVTRVLISRCFPLICVRIAVHLILDWETEPGGPGTAHVIQAAKPRASCWMRCIQGVLR
jgi:hypothetical protein